MTKSIRTDLDRYGRIWIPEIASQANFSFPHFPVFLCQPPRSVPGKSPPQKKSAGRKTPSAQSGDARQASLFDDYEPSSNFWADTEADNPPRSEPVATPFNIAPNFGAIKHHIRQMPPLSKAQKTDLAPLMQRMAAIWGAYSKRHNTP